MLLCSEEETWEDRGHGSMGPTWFAVLRGPRCLNLPKCLFIDFDSLNLCRNKQFIDV